jgi:hypothetical protein
MRAIWPGQLQRALTCLALALPLLTPACKQDGETGTKSGDIHLLPAPPALPRLTRAQYETTVHDLLGADLILPPTLEPDAPFDDLLAVGASIAKVSPRGVELYEDAARSLAAQVAGKPARLAVLLPCQPTSSTDGACAEQFVTQVGRRLWRRPLQPQERAAIVGIAVQAAQTLGTFQQGLEYALVALLQAPSFLYRPERGEPDPHHAGHQRLTGLELASRLSYFLWNGPPDPALLDAAQAGQLDDAQGLQTQVDRMLADPKLARAVRNFADEWLQLQSLASLSKDPKVYKHFSSDLGDSAREETLRLFHYLVLERDADLRELLTTRTTFVDRRLAAIYDVPAVTDKGLGQIELPVGERQGLLGQVSFLALQAHPVSSSPTLRGRYLRRYLLCDEVPNPPAGLNTALPEPTTTAKTMRERLASHMATPGCKGCHKLMDPLGLGFERFDGIGRFRQDDNGTPVDTSGDLDGVKFSDAASLGQAVAQSPRFDRCIVRKLYAYAVGRRTGEGEAGQLDALTTGFTKSGRRLRGLMRTVALSEGFRALGPRSTATDGGTP